MCDLGTLEAVLGTAAALITAAIALIAVATALNGGFFSAPAAPVPMAAAAVSTAAAIGFLIAARTMAESYFQCMGAPDSCLGHYTNLMNALDGLITTLGIQTAATAALAAAAWIPWAIIPGQIAVVASLIVQLALIPTIIVFWSDLKSCLAEAAAASVTGPLIVSIGIFVLIGLWTSYYSIRRKNKTRG